MQARRKIANANDMDNKLSSDRKLTFGKYKGKSVREVMDINPSYLIWAHDNVKFFTLNDYEYNRCIEALRRASTSRQVGRTSLSGYLAHVFEKHHGNEI